MTVNASRYANIDNNEGPGESLIVGLKGLFQIGSGTTNAFLDPTLGGLALLALTALIMVVATLFSNMRRAKNEVTSTFR